MKSITPYILSFCLLILVSGCSKKSPSNSSEKPIIGLTEASLLETISGISKPYVLVNFYATWCKPCIQELPELIALKNDPQSEVDVLLISVDDEQIRDKQLGAFLDKMNITFPSYHLSPDSLNSFVDKVYPEWNTTIPLNFVYTNDGRLVEATGITDQMEVSMIIHEDQASAINLWICFTQLFVMTKIVYFTLTGDIDCMFGLVKPGLGAGN